jgi:hypothetical protein
MIRVALIFGVGVFSAFGIGLWEELGDPSRWQEWSFAALALIWTVAAALVLRSAGASALLVAILLPVVLCAGVLGDFYPFVSGYEGRDLRDYAYETPWEFWLPMSMVFFSFFGIIVGVVVASVVSIRDARWLGGPRLPDDFDALTFDNFADRPDR